MTDLEYKKELLVALLSDCLDFADREGRDWDWNELCDFLIRRGWRNVKVGNSKS